MDLVHTDGAHVPAPRPRAGIDSGSARGDHTSSKGYGQAMLAAVWLCTPRRSRVQCPQRRADLVLRRSPPTAEQPLCGCAAAIRLRVNVAPSAALAERAARTQRAKPYQPPPLTRSCAFQTMRARTAGCGGSR